MSQILAEPKQNIQKIYGFDYLRAIFSIVVVIWHVFQPWTIQPQNFLTFVVMIISYDFLLLAVPVFLQISLFLFYVNRNKNPNYLKNRIPKLLQMYVFWVVLYFLIRLPENQVNFSIFPDLSTIFEFILSGGNSLFYFFITLIILLIIAEINWQVINQQKCLNPLKINHILLITSTLFVLLLPIIYIYKYQQFIALISYWNSLNFLPCVFSSYWVFKHYNHHKKSQKNLPIISLVILILFYLFFACIEWQYLYYNQEDMWLGGYQLPTYTRLSLFFGSWSLLLAGSMYSAKPPLIINILSKYSLGIYCLHIFLNGVMDKILTPIWAKHNLINDLISLVIVVPAAILLTKFLRRYKLFHNVI